MTVEDVQALRLATALVFAWTEEQLVPVTLVVDEAQQALWRST